MAPKRADTALHALATLRERIAAGGYPCEARLPAAEVGTEFGLSPTPMREVLSRLAGEGLLEERRGQGFFLRRLPARDIADLYRLTFAHLRIALETGTPPAAAAGGAGSLHADPGEETAVSERVFRDWVLAAGGRALAQSFLRVQAQLGRARRLEPQVLEGLAEEWSVLGRADLAQRMTPLRAYFARRVRAAPALAEILEARASRAGAYDR